jgi:hypothetical protein
MKKCSTLRIENNDGTIVEYRIGRNCIETRMLEQPRLTGNPWQPLTPTQITSLVVANTAVAYWLTRSVGVRRLLKSCGDGLSKETNPNELHLLLRELATFQQSRVSKHATRKRKRVRST